MLRKVGATQWTIGKLMTMVLLVIVLALVVYGVSTKGLNPLIEKAGGMFDSVQILFGVKEGIPVEGDCGKPYLQYIEMVGEGMVTKCKGSCSVKFEEGLSFGNEFNWTDNSLFVQSGTHQEEIFDSIGNLPLAIKEREVNKILMEDYENYLGVMEDSFFMSSRNVPIYFLIKGNFGRGRYFKWEDGIWFEEKDNKWETGNWKNDFEGLKEIYSESDDLFNDDEVFYSIGIPEGVMESVLEREDFISFENIRAGEDSYDLLDIFVGDSGQIDSESDFRLFQDWFSLEREKIIEGQDILDEGFEGAKELLPSESFGEFEGERYYLFLVRDSGGEGVFYLETPSERYGLKGDSLILVKGDERDGWRIAESSSTLFKTPEEFEEDIKIHKIRTFLEGLRC